MEELGGKKKNDGNGVSDVLAGGAWDTIWVTGQAPDRCTTSFPFFAFLYHDIKALSSRHWPSMARA